MQTVAFLRGMNVGGHRITNADLVKAFATMGFEGVSTYRASGNVLLPEVASSELAARIANGLEGALGYAVPTLVRSASEVMALANDDPFSAEERARSRGKVQVMLLDEEMDARTRDRVRDQLPADEALVFRDRALLWLPAAGILDSSFDWQGIQRTLGLTTTRTQGTFQGIAKKLTPR